MPANQPHQVQRSSRAQLLSSLGEGFAPLIIFYIFEHAWGLLPAIISGIVVGVLLVVRQIVREKKVSGLTVFIALSVVVFGALELRYQTGFFVKLEPALGNGMTGLFLLGVVALKKPLLANLAEKQSGRPLAEWQRQMMQQLTFVWGVFFLARSAGFVWMAYHLTVDQAMGIRASVGNILYVVMIGAQILYARLCRRRAAEAAVAEKAKATAATSRR